jgi:hypothetical protein
MIGGSDFQTFGRYDVTLGLVFVAVLNQRDVGGAIRIVFESDNFARDSVQAALEVHNAIHPLVAAAFVAGRHAALIVATRRLFERRGQRLLGTFVGEFGIFNHRHRPTRRRSRIERFNCHNGRFGKP